MADQKGRDEMELLVVADACELDGFPERAKRIREAADEIERLQGGLESHNGTIDRCIHCDERRTSFKDKIGY